MKESPIEEHTRLGNDYLEWEYTAQALFAASAILNRERERVETPFKPGPAPMESQPFWIELILDAFGVECLIKAMAQTRASTRSRREVRSDDNEGSSSAGE